MKIDQMRQLLEIAKSKSLSKASQNMFISQQALSSSIRKMEEELNVQLMIRTNHGVVLTKEGEYFANGFNRILEEYDTLVINANNHQENIVSANDIIVFTNYGALEAFLADAISELPKDKVGKVHVKEGSFEDIVENVIEEKCDFGIHSFSKKKGEQDPEYENLNTVTLFRSPLYVKVSDSSPLAKRKALSFEDILEENILIYNSHVWHVNYLLETLSTLKDGFDYRVEENYQLHASMVSSGHAISFGVLGGKFSRQTKGIKLIKLDEPLEVVVACFIKKGKIVAPHVQFFINHLQLECNR